MDIDALMKRDTFNVKEAYHIKSLSLRKEALEAQEKRNGKLDFDKQEELAALKWIFRLLDEISND